MSAVEQIEHNKYAYLLLTQQIILNLLLTKSI